MASTVKALALDAAPHSAADAVMDVRLRMRDGAPFIVRTAQRFGGVALSVAALTLLLFPFGSGSATEILCKLMVALILGFAGVALWQAGSPVASPEMEIDMVRREVRMVRWLGTQRVETSKAAFSELGRAEIVGKTVRLWDGADLLLAELDLPDDGAVRSLQRALQDEGLAV